MTDQSVFEDKSNSEGTPPVQTPPVDQMADLLKSIKNEKGEQKYSSVEKALEALAHSQQYIPELKSELTKKDEQLMLLQQELSEKARLEEIIERLANGKPEGEGIPPKSTEPDKASLEAMLNDMLTKREQQSKAEQNLKTVNDRLVALYGDKAAEVLEKKASEFGTTKTELAAIARSNPAMVLALFQTQTQGAPKPSTSSISIPPINKDEGLKPPSKSLLSGAKHRDVVDYMKEIRENVYKKYGVEQN